MTGHDTDLGVRRILVPLDASPNARLALEVAANLASCLRAQLIGLFVEDSGLVNLTELPFAQEVSCLTATVRRLERAQVEQQMRVQASRMRLALTEVCERLGLPYAFHVARGAVAAQVLAAAAEADLVIMGRCGWSLAGERRMGSTVRALLRRGRRMTFVICHESYLQGPTLLVYDGSPLSWKALNAAAHLCRIRNAGLHAFLLLQSRSQDALRQLREELHHGLRVHGVTAAEHALVAPPLSRLVHAIALQRGGPLVIPATIQALEEAEVQILLENVQNPVLLVR